MKIHIYKDRKGEWRWRIVKRGKILGDSGEGYKRRSAAEKAILRIIDAIGRGEVEIAE